jgi:hypothetical protein
VKLLLFALVAVSALQAQTVPPPTPPAAVKQPTPEPAPARLLEVKTVYLLKMARGMQQYLAHQLTKEKLLVVTTDPTRADTLLTDHVGKEFEEEVAALFPAASAPPAPENDREEASSGFKGDKVPHGTWGRGRGTVFLVDRVNGDVLWSHYAPSPSGRSQDLEATAGKVVDRLKDDLDRLRNPSKKGLFGK